MNLISVVILNYNGAKHLQEFLPSVTKFSSGAEVVVIDNGSSDSSLEVLSSSFPDVRVIKIDRNLGFTGGYNQGLTQVESKYFVLLNSDVEVTAGWIQPILELMEQDPTVAACQPKILSYHNRDTFEYAGAGGGYLDYLGYPFCRGRLFTTLEKDHGQYDDVRKVFWASGACMFIRSDSFWELGGFDQRFFAHMEEIDLCWRIQRKGYQVRYHGQSTVYHLGGGTLHKSHPRKTYLNFKNSITMLYQNSDSRNLWFRVLSRLFLDLLAAGKFLVLDSPKDGWAVIKADWEFLAELRSSTLVRRALKDQSDKKPIAELYPRSIVVDYYILGKRRFEDLMF